MNIAIFCSANDNIDKKYFEKTRELGEWIAKNNHFIVYGGSDSGLMECVAKAVHNAGGRTIGVVPSIIEKGGRTSDYVDVNIKCDNLSDRKDLMLAKSNIAVALPGGLGTLDEIFTVVSSACIGYHKKRVILYNIDGFWNSLIALLNDLNDKNMIRGDYHDQILIANNMDEIKSYVEQQ